jgi:hypothetical protein
MVNIPKKGNFAWDNVRGITLNQTFHRCYQRLIKPEIFKIIDK